MKLIIGLGNPGKEYEKTRHNAGFMAVDRLAQRQMIPGSVRMKFHAGVMEGLIGSEKVALIQPTTFMNRSGRSVQEAMRFYKLEADDILVLVDDIALPLGRVRLRGSGGAGGHNGLKDIQRALGTGAYPRLRIGIDGPGRVPQVDYVLGRFRGEELDRLDAALDRSCEIVEAWLKDGIEKTMSLFNAKD